MFTHGLFGFGATRRGLVDPVQYWCYATVMARTAWHAGDGGQVPSLKSARRTLVAWMVYDVLTAAAPSVCVRSRGRLVVQVTKLATGGDSPASPMTLQKASDTLNTDDFSWNKSRIFEVMCDCCCC